MSEPRYSKTNQLDCAIHELISARSALNMYPDPIPGDPNRYISESDGWVKHAMEHLDMVSRMLIELQTEYGRDLGFMAWKKAYTQGYEDAKADRLAALESLAEDAQMLARRTLDRQTEATDQKLVDAARRVLGIGGK